MLLPDNYVCYTHEGEVIEKITSFERDTGKWNTSKFKQRLSVLLGVPPSFFEPDFYSVAVSNDGAYKSDESTADKAFSFFQSIIYNNSSCDFIVKLDSPQALWISDLPGDNKIIELKGSQVRTNNYIAAASENSRFISWSPESFLNKYQVNQPFYFDLSQIEWNPVSLPEFTSILSARFISDDTVSLILGKYVPPPDPKEISLPQLQIGRTVANYGDQPAEVDFLGFLHGVYDYGIDYGFFGGGALQYCRELLSYETDEEIRKQLLLWEKSDSTSLSNAFFHSERMCLLDQGRAISWDQIGNNLITVSDSNNAIKIFAPMDGDECVSVRVLNGFVLIITLFGIYSLDLETLEPIDSYRFPIDNRLARYSAVREVVSLSTDKSEIYCVAENGAIQVIQMSGEGKFSWLVDILRQVDGSPVLSYPDNYYLRLSQTTEGLHFSDGTRTFPFEQFDLRLNRPDIVLERLGAPEEAVAIAKHLREKRLIRTGVTEEMLKPDFHLPDVAIVGELPINTEIRQIEVAISATDSRHPLERLRVYVNNVPINGREGESLRHLDVQSLDRKIPIKLASGRNKIQISVLNSAGAESLYATAEINCMANRPNPTLYAVALGVSQYENSQWNLKYAAKDAKDVLAQLRTRSSPGYKEVQALLLVDSEVTKESLGKIREFLGQSTIDDTVLMFVAGHGLLDDKYDYFFATTDIDFDNPADRGITFEEFDDILADLPSLKKSLFIDTCHAGELDEEEKKMLASAGGVAAVGLPAGQWHDRIQSFFADLRRGSGSTILSSSAGAEYAFESSEQQNGLFTYAVLEALGGEQEADANGDGKITISELAKYVKPRVAELTNNKQTPNVRRVNLEGDFAITTVK